MGVWSEANNLTVKTIYVQKHHAKSRTFIWADHAARMEEDRSAFKVLTGTPTGKRPLGRPKCRWEEDIRMYLKEIGINTRNWVDFAQDSDY